MKALSRLSAILGLLLSMLAWSCGPAAPPPQVAESPSTKTKAKASIAPQLPDLDPFAGCKGDSFRVDYLDALDAIADGSLAQQEEQLRDWLWTALLGRLATRSSTEDVFTRSLLDLPARRLDGLPRVLRGADGKARVTTTESDEVVVLLDRTEPSSSAQQLVLDAVDAEAMRSGHMPARARVYGYVLEPRVAKAAVCQLEELTRSDLEATERGFRSVKATNAAQLDDFLAGGVDLLSAHCDATGLELSGRHRERGAGAPLRAEHVSVLAHAYRDTPNASVGFSLDPNYDEFDLVGLRKDLVAAASANAETLSGIVASWKLDATLAAELHAAAGNERQVAELRDYASGLLRALEAAAEPDPAQIQEVLLQRMLETPRPDARGAMGDAMLARHARQCPRYDGPLRGSEVGMTLYYTDLVAKLWAMDWRSSAPEAEISGFRAAPHQTVSTNNCGGGSEQGRLWFGMRSEGVLTWPSGAVSFEPQATRLFGKAQGLFQEVDFQAQDTRVVLQWWDRHYAEVASHEPQYELLNQIMKWSAFLASSGEQRECVAGLVPKPPLPAQRFDRWATAHRELRFKDATSLVRAPSECVGVYSSDVYRYCQSRATLAGGVSLADARQVVGRRRPAALPRAAEHVDAAATPLEATKERIRYASLDRPDANLKNVAIEREKSKVRGTLGLEAKQLTRGARESWLLDPQRPSLVEREVKVSGGKLLSDQRLASFGAGHLTVEDLELAEVKLASKGDPIQTARAVADRVLEQRAQGKAFDLAVTAAFPKGPVLLVNGNEAWFPFVEGDKLSGYGVISSGGGNRGPPGFVLGVATTGATDGPGRTPDILVSVELRALDDAARERFKHLAAAQAWLTDVGRVTRQGDLAGATRLLEQQLKLDPSLAASSQFQKEILSTTVLAARSGEQSPALEHLQMLASIQGAMDRSTKTGTQELKALGQTATVYAPLDFPSTADLPPISHPPGSSPRPNQRFVSKVFDAAYDTLPQEISYAKRRLTKRAAAAGRADHVDSAQDLGAGTGAGPGAAASARGGGGRGPGGGVGAGSGGSGGVGPSQRLIRRYRYPIVVVSRCDDDDEDLPPCHCSDIDPYVRPCDESRSLTVVQSSVASH